MWCVSLCGVCVCVLDGLMGMAIVGGGVAVAAAAVGLFAVAFSKK